MITLIKVGVDSEFWEQERKRRGKIIFLSSGWVNTGIVTLEVSSWMGYACYSSLCCVLLRKMFKHGIPQLCLVFTSVFCSGINEKNDSLQFMITW